MDLNLTTEELSFRDELRAWLVSNVPKDWNEWRESPLRNRSHIYALGNKSSTTADGQRFHGRGNTGVAAPR